MLSAAHTSSFDSPDLACVSPEFLCCDHCSIIRVSAVYSKKMGGNTGCLFLSRKFVDCQHYCNLCDDSFAFPDCPLCCSIHHPPKYESKKTILLFFLLPLAYYILEYTFTVYTDLLYTGGPVVIDFMDSFIVLFFFILSMLSLDFSNKKNEAERENLLLTTAATQAQKEIEQLSISQKQASIYRHDLRHHMTFLQNCIAKNKLDQALEYIHQICTDIDNSRVIRYCNNEALNLILSSYADQARDAEIDVQISVTATDFARFQITDLCSLFANALENAIHACEKIPTSEKRYITLKVFEKNGRICINIANNYVQNPVFENEIPTSHEANHGIGVRSMISVVEKYHGVYGFFTENKEFRFQASL